MFEKQGILREFFITFIPIFVAIDPIGVVPAFLSLTEGLSKKSKQSLIYSATMTAFVISMIFLFSGRWLFRFLGITENDFRIAGGIVLLIIAIMDLLFSNDENRKPADATAGIVPLGIPLIMGPAALTTILISVQHHGFWQTGVALLVNLVLVALTFLGSGYIVKIMGKSGTKAFAKVANLFVAAIAVMMIRVGLTAIIKGF